MAPTMARSWAMVMILCPLRYPNACNCSSSPGYNAISLFSQFSEACADLVPRVYAIASSRLP